MKKLFYYTTLLFVLCVAGYTTAAQTSIGIGTTTPDPNAVLDINSNQKGVLFPRLTTAQQTTLAAMLGPSELGMIVTDAGSGTPRWWTGSAWRSVSAGNSPAAAAPLSLTANHIQLNAGTAAGQLITWDGNNWVNMQPAIQTFSLSYDNHQPYLAMNYVISLAGTFPSRTADGNPYLGEIFLMGCNYAPVNFATCDGQLLSISQFQALFSLLGSSYGGDGTTNFALPDLRSRIPVGMGAGVGTSSYTIGETRGTETKTFAH
jgi:microcystin-dependent protein